jgi:hypothetical protein
MAVFLGKMVNFLSNFWRKYFKDTFVTDPEIATVGQGGHSRDDA